MPNGAIANKNEKVDEHFEAISKQARLEEIKRSQVQRKIKKLETLLSQGTIDLDKLKEIVWQGIPQSKFIKSF